MPQKRTPRVAYFRAFATRFPPHTLDIQMLGQNASRADFRLTDGVLNSMPSRARPNTPVQEPARFWCLKSCLTG
jgi:hypothetical protein